MRITTWNINSVRLRLSSVERFLKAAQPDILCLQEIKCQDDQFPAKALEKAGYPYQAVRGQKGYHGVATISKTPFEDSESTDFCGKADARHVCTRLQGGIELHNFYVPAGGDVPDPEENEKFAYKLAFLDEMKRHFQGVSKRPAIIVGDLNIAPQEHDVWSHKQLLKVVSHTPIEVELLESLRAAGRWCDVMRALIPSEEKLYTWWSYRSKDWRLANKGRRLDHIWVTPPLVDRALAGGRDALSVHEDVRGWERPSDHAPVTLTFAAQ